MTPVRNRAAGLVGDGNNLPQAAIPSYETSTAIQRFRIDKKGYFTTGADGKEREYVKADEYEQTPEVDQDVRRLTAAL